MVPSSRLATQTPSRPAARSLWPCPTGTVWRTVCVAGSIRETLPFLSSATQIAPAAAATAEGGPSSGTCARSERSSGSIMRHGVAANRRDLASRVGPHGRDGGAGDGEGCGADQHGSPGGAPAAAAAPACRPRPERGARVGHQRRARLASSGRILGQRSRDHGVQRDRQHRCPVTHARRRRLQVPVDDRRLVGPGERDLAGEALEQHAAERVHVSGRARLLAADHLRRHVGDRPHHLPAGGDRIGAARLGEPEVGEIDVLARSLARDERVARLHVAVDQPARMRRVERLGQLPDELDRPRRLERTLAPQQLREVAAVDVAHGDVQQSVGVTGLVDRDDPGVVDRRGQVRLALEARPEARIARELGREQLQRDLPAEPQVRRPIHDAHAAPTEELLDAIRPDAAANIVDRRGGHVLLPPPYLR